MDCVICNKNHTQYIRLDGAKSVAVPPSSMQVFEKQKAINICKSLPKSMKNLGFRVEEIGMELEKPKTPWHRNDCEDTLEVEITINDNVKDWTDKAYTCSKLLREAVVRKPELEAALNMLEAETQDILHEIELLPWLNPCKAYVYYKRLKKVRMERRGVKDELLILDKILDSNIDLGQLEDVISLASGMRRRKYGFRSHRTVEVTND